MLAKAIALAAQAHLDQQDKNGDAYILHPLRMMFTLKTETEMIVAVLHDVIEDTDWSLDNLRAEGFSEEVVTAVDALTRREDETYDEFVARAAANPLSRTVKLADLEDNMNIRRLDHLADKDLARLQRYHKHWRALQAGDRPPAT
jgi:(p)ppGpp synthase/HD superfamily hydrolase